MQKIGQDDYLGFPTILHLKVSVLEQSISIFEQESLAIFIFRVGNCYSTQILIDIFMKAKALSNGLIDYFPLNIYSYIH